MARRRKPRQGDVELTQEEQWQQHRGRCRGPAQWAKYSDKELAAMQHRAQLLRGEGYGSDDEYLVWLWQQK